MNEENPTLKDIWRRLGTMNQRFNERFDAVERQVVSFKAELSEDIAQLRSEVGALRAQTQTQSGLGALKESIEARGFRLDEHGRRLTELESLRP